MSNLKSTTKKDKLTSDLAIHLSKPLAILLTATNPLLAIIFFAISLYFSIQHALAHIRRIEAKKKIKGESLHFRAKAGIMLSRMGFDLLGLGLSLGLIIIGVYASGILTDSLAKQLLLTGQIGMVLSSVASTAHKIRRFARGDYTYTHADLFRAVFGVISTVFLGCVLFGVIPAILLVHPIVLSVGTLMIVTMGIFKLKKVWAVQQQQALLHQALEDDFPTLAETINKSTEILNALKDLGDDDVPDLIESQVEKILGKIGENIQAAEEQIPLFRKFCETFGVTGQTILDSHQVTDQNVKNYLEVVFKPEVVISSPQITLHSPRALLYLRNAQNEQIKEEQERSHKVDCPPTP